MFSLRMLIPAVVVVLWALMAVLSQTLNLHPDFIQLEKILHTNDAQSWLGYDDLGRPIWDRLLVGAYTSFVTALGVVSISLVTGTFLGVVAAYAGGIWDHLLVRIIDVFLAFPGILLAIALAGILGPGIDNVIIALSVVGWVGFARLARAQVLIIKHREHVQAAVAMGCRKGRIVVRHLIPLISAPLIIEATFAVAAVVIGEAGLSFLGLGVQPPEASWGSMIRDGACYLLVAPHMVLIPSVALMLVVLAVNLLGDRLRDHLDVRELRRG